MTRHSRLTVAVVGLIACALAGFAAHGAAAAQASSIATQFILDGFPDQIEIRAEAADISASEASLQLRLLPDGEPTILDAEVEGANLRVVVQTGKSTSAWDWLPVGR